MSQITWLYIGKKIFKIGSVDLEILLTDVTNLTCLL